MHVERIVHTIEPVFDGASRVLVLGTMPSPASREVGFYYGHPQNRFWRVMERLYGQDESSLVNNELRRAFLLDHHIALWDVLASCDIAGASDASIANAIPNDLTRVLDAAPIQTVCTTGGKAAQLCRRYHGELLSQRAIDLVELPSTSPANARMRLDDLVRAYRAVGVFEE
jgi:TDG/mug DNA glycosylase family protein